MAIIYISPDDLVSVNDSNTKAAFSPVIVFSHHHFFNALHSLGMAYSAVNDEDRYVKQRRDLMDEARQVRPLLVSCVFMSNLVDVFVFSVSYVFVS